MKFIFLWLVLFSFGSCIAYKPVAGTYRSRFASMGFFVTTIQFNKDSTLHYNFKGDLINRSATGYYHRQGDTLLLYYVWNNSDYVDMIAGLPGVAKNILPAKDSLQYRESYFVGHHKLFPIHLVTGKTVRRDSRYHKTKKYIFIGSHYYKERYYLMRLKQNEPD